MEAQMIKRRKAIHYSYNKGIKKLLERFNEEKPISYSELLRQNQCLRKSNENFLRDLEEADELADHLRSHIEDYKKYFHRYNTTLRLGFDIYERDDTDIDIGCPICFGDILKNQYIFRTPCCLKYLHSQCVLRLAPLKCPFCRACISCHYASNDDDSDSSFST